MKKIRLVLITLTSLLSDFNSNQWVILSLPKKGEPAVFPHVLQAFIFHDIQFFTKRFAYTCLYTNMSTLYTLPVAVCVHPTVHQSDTPLVL